MKNEPKRSLNVALPHLSPNERAVLCGLLRDFSRHKDAHPGMLPFLNVEEAVEVMRLTMVDRTNRGSRIYAEIAAKLAPFAKVTGKETSGYLMKLNPTKILKRLGHRVEQGVEVQWLPTLEVEAGIRWSEWQKKHVPNKITVKPCIRIRPITGGMFRVDCHKLHWPKVSLYLIDNCT